MLLLAAGTVPQAANNWVAILIGTATLVGTLIVGFFALRAAQNTKSNEGTVANLLAVHTQQDTMNFTELREASTAATRAAGTAALIAAQSHANQVTIAAALGIQLPHPSTPPPL